MPFVPSRKTANPDPASSSESISSNPEQNYRRRSSDPISKDDLPLSISFMKRPSRSSFSGESDEIMKLNTILNSKTHSPPPSQEMPESEVDYEFSPEPIRSPASLPDSKYQLMSPLVRKKSGELVKSSLKLNSLDGSSKSLPSTPTYKQVHFGGNIAVKYFDEADKPSSISAGNSPFVSDDEYNSECESDDDYFGPQDTIYSVSKEYVESGSQRSIEKFKKLIKAWDFNSDQFRRISYRDQIDKETPVFLERCFLSVDKTELLGQIAVKNLSYQKSVTVRYTFNDWETAINMEASYVPDIPRLLKRANYDRFIFKLSVPTLFSQFYSSHQPLVDQDPCFYLCVRYVSDDQVFWDNNYRKNYELRFSTEASRAKAHRKSSHHENMYSSKFLRKSASFEDVSSALGSKNASNPRSFPELDNALKDLSLPKPSRAGQHQQIPYDFHQETILDSSMNSPGTPLILQNVSAAPTFTDLMSPSLPLKVKNENEPNQKEKEISPTTKVPEDKIPPVSEYTGAANHSRKPEINSKSYQQLLENYCFFQGPSTVSSFLDNNNANEKSQVDNKFGHDFY
ncbi:hypothetical protein KL910_002745 [Ogataea haglerorum]|nr:hypothetical protein KL910_002745 [Ogataea haglerorum]KAG7790497.1 hypothetical protein KL945_001378 [Ogataea haglerorum]